MADAHLLLLAAYLPGRIQAPTPLITFGKIADQGPRLLPEIFRSLHIGCIAQIWSHIPAHGGQNALPGHHPAVGCDHLTQYFFQGD